MKSFKFLLLVIFFIVSCSETESDVQEINETVANETTAIDNEIIWSQGIGKSPGEFVSNWNKLIDSISDDQDTITFFSIDPDGVYQVSNEKETLVYRFGNSSETDNIFVLNLKIEKHKKLVYGRVFSLAILYNIDIVFRVLSVDVKSWNL